MNDDFLIDVIIRTRDCDCLLEPNLNRLQHSTITPKVILVDNGSVMSRMGGLRPVNVHLKYSLPTFNYAMAINMAIPFLSNNYCLIISQHTHLANPEALRFAVNFLNAKPDGLFNKFMGSYLSDKSNSETEKTRTYENC